MGKKKFRFTIQIRLFASYLLLTIIFITTGLLSYSAFLKMEQQVRAVGNKMGSTALQAALASGQQARMIILVSMFVSVVITLFAAVMQIRGITVPLKQVNRQLLEIAEGEGDLTRELAVKSNDEIADLAASFNRMTAQLRHLIGQVAFGAEQVASTAEELNAGAEQTTQATEHIATTIQEVATGTEKQVVGIEESMEVVTDLSQGVKQIAINAHQVSTSAEETSQLADHGNESIQQAIRQMQKIDGTISGLATEIQQLGASSTEIGQIIEVITSIAAQTNLLALNAAIEAARAGEHGRGFSVVADEVRKLAEQSVNSAQQITGLITAIQEGVDRASQSMAAGTREVTTGLSVMTEAGESFAQIRTSVGMVASQILEVSAATEQMSASTQQVENTIVNIASIAEAAAYGTQNVSASAQQQLASMEEISASSQSLSGLAQELLDLVGKFKV